jgi:mxaK protein
VVRRARAGGRGRAGAHDAAFKAYGGVIRSGELDALGRQALFNLGNMYLRQALAGGGNDALPLIELAKQRYRDLLRAMPDDWDARYNLERALRLAPEDQEAVAEEDNVPVERRRVMLRGMDPGDLP